MSGDRPRLPQPVKRALMLLVILLVVEYLILPQIAGVRKSLSLLSSVDFTFVLAGLVFEAGALAAYAQLTRAVIPRGQGPSFFTLLRIGLTTLSVSHILPGGAAAGSGLGYRLLTEAGVSGPDAAFALGTQAIGSAVVLNVLLWVGLVISIPLRGFNPIYFTAAIVGVIVIGAFSGLVLLLTRGEDRAALILRGVARRVPFLEVDTVDAVVRRLAQRVDALMSDRALVRRAILWATANWLLDAASLWVFLAAFGYRVGIDGLIVSYGLANVLAAIPITPGGLGVVEAVLTSSLVGFGSLGAWRSWGSSATGSLTSGCRSRWEGSPRSRCALPREHPPRPSKSFGGLPRKDLRKPRTRAARGLRGTASRWAKPATTPPNESFLASLVTSALTPRPRNR